MSKKPETLFRKKLRDRLDSIPNAWFESIQQIGISGTPDLLGCVGPLFVAIEVKTDKGVSSALQIYKRKMITNCGAIALVISPSNLDASINFIENMARKCSDLGHGKKERTDD